MSREFCAYLADQLAPWASITVKRLFGGFGVYRDGQIFAIVADDMLYFKVDDTNREDYVSACSEMFTYEARGKTNSLSYWQVPAEVMDDPDTLADWAEKAYQAGLRAQRKQSRK